MTLWEEIHQQPETLQRLAATGRSTAEEVARYIHSTSPAFVVIAARGTSDNAARYAKYLWGARNGMVVALAAPSLISTPGPPPRLAGGLVVAISQSGRSPDVVGVVEEAAAQGRPTVAITNDPGSPLAAAAEVCFDLGVGEERSIAATKTYTAELAAVALVSDALRGEVATLDAVPRSVESVLADSASIAGVAEAFARDRFAAVLGRGVHYATAFEWALKLQELASVLAHAYSTADFAHGPLALVTRGFPVLAVTSAGPLHARARALLERVSAELGGRLAVISDDRSMGDLAEGSIVIPVVAEWLSPIVATVAAQLFTYHLTVAKGSDPDAPPTIAKVTETL